LPKRNERPQSALIGLGSSWQWQPRRCNARFFQFVSSPANEPCGTAKEELIYTPGIFDRNSLAAAKQVILTVPRDIADEFWQRSTIATGKLILEAIRPTRDDVLLDFGCGIGRLAKELIGHTGCRIVGVDISAAMRRYAIEYVGSDRFSVMSAEEFSPAPVRSAAHHAPLPQSRSFARRNRRALVQTVPK
jgi:SAM-dependent methyltransferase